MTVAFWQAHALAAGARKDGSTLCPGRWRAAYEAAVEAQAARAAALKERLRATYAAHDQLKQHKRIQARRQRARVRGALASASSDSRRFSRPLASTDDGGDAGVRRAVG